MTAYRNWLVLLRCGVSVLLGACLAGASFGQSRDSAADINPLLDALTHLPPPPETVFEIAPNLNDRDLARRLESRRVGGFPDLPAGLLPDSDDLLAFETGFIAGDIGGLALLENSQSGDSNFDTFHRDWYQAESTERFFISFHRSDLDLAGQLEQLAEQLGYVAILLTPMLTAEQVGRLYVLAGHRLAIDSRDARRYDSNLSEFEFLGERLGRNDSSLFGDTGEEMALARNEPSKFRKSTLGDEHTASTIEEIIVPGGIALGEIAQLELAVEALRFRGNSLQLIDTTGKVYSLPALELSTAKALYDFVVRSETINSDAIVDIDAEGRVKISSALRDTEVGYDFMRLDTFPFEFVKGLPVSKSVIVDSQVSFATTVASALAFETIYEIRFLSADTMRIAQTRVALEYTYGSDGDSRFGYQWGRDLGRLDENLDYTGLGISTGPVAAYAAWIALFRKLYTEQITFVDGRYEFMKIDKTGRRTPTRF
ncbi:MAG: hypothetical protein WD772_04990 [Pseudohongiellaceae bacterium]